MVAFILSMPKSGSWDGKWSGSGTLYAKVFTERGIPKELLGRDFYYSWDDGWTACVSVEKVDSRRAAQIRKASRGFFGYDWMIKSIVEDGYIHTLNDNNGAN